MSQLRTVGFWVLGTVVVLGAGCGALPQPPAHPYYGINNKGPGADPTPIYAAAQQQSDALYAYIDGWFKGQNPARIPDALLPNGKSPDIVDFTLIPESAIDATQWGLRLARPIDWNAEPGQFPDPHATYAVIPSMVGPFGTKVIVEGQFPKARYFSIYSSPAFFPPGYRWGYAGSAETGWLDADIDPLPGHVNPFRVGANRNATSRSFRVECTMQAGDPVALDPGAWSIPNFRQQGNTRACAGVAFRGPWGDPDWKAADPAHAADGRGMFDVGTLWVRYYAPDHACDAFACVPLPKVTYELPDGRRFFIKADFSKFEQFMNMKPPVEATAAANPSGRSGPGWGWNKMYGIFRNIAGGLSYDYGWYLPFGGISGMTPQQYTDALDYGVTNRNAAQTSVMVREPSETTMVHASYLTRNMCINTGRVAVVSGTMPTFPDTRGGAATMTAGEMRYFSITGYNSSFDPLQPVSETNMVGQPITTIMDDEIVLDAQRRYIIVYSRAADRPSNATAANGVTWKEWGPQGCQGWTLRWIHAGPEWTFAKTPNQTNLGWNTDWATPGYNQNLVGRNNRTGFLGAYQPVVSYVTKTTFQGYGSSGIFGKLPAY